MTHRFSRVFKAFRRSTLLPAGVFACLPGFIQAEEIQLPELGDASSSIISPQLERQIGESFLKQINASLPTVRDPILKYYTALQLSTLAEYSDLREGVMSTVLIDSDEINAFAAPGGIVGINAGLYLHATDVHEYSAVIAHELAHLSQRHFARGVEEQRAATLPTLASLIAALMIGVAGGGEAGIAAISAAQAAAQSNQLRYSRSREAEADRVGFNTMIRAGMDPAAMSRMFERMQRAYRFTRRPPEFLLTHPLTESRIADARSQAQSFAPATYPEDQEFHMMRARVQLQYADNVLDAIKTFSKQLDENPDSVPAQYGLAIAYSKQGEHARAIALGERLLSMNPRSIILVSTQAELLTNAGQARQAAELLSHHLVLNPDNYPLGMLYAEALISQQKYSEAQSVLQRQTTTYPNDTEAWFQLAEVSGQAGDITQVHLARAEYFALHGNYHRAIQHLQYARRLLSKTDTQSIAKVDQRIFDLREALRIAAA